MYVLSVLHCLLSNVIERKLANYSTMSARVYVHI